MPDKFETLETLLAKHGSLEELLKVAATQKVKVKIGDSTYRVVVPVPDTLKKAD